MTKPNPENCKNCSSKCAYHWAQLSTQHSTDQSSDTVCWRGEGCVCIGTWRITTQASLSSQSKVNSGRSRALMPTPSPSCCRSSSTDYDDDHAGPSPYRTSSYKVRHIYARPTQPLTLGGRRNERWPKCGYTLFCDCEVKAIMLVTVHLYSVFWTAHFLT